MVEFAKCFSRLFYEANPITSIFREVKCFAQDHTAGNRPTKRSKPGLLAAKSSAPCCLPVVISDLMLAGVTGLTCSCRQKTLVDPPHSEPSCCRTLGSPLPQPRRGIPGPEFHQTLHPQRCCLALWHFLQTAGQPRSVLPPGRRKPTGELHRESLAKGLEFLHFPLNRS